MVWLVEISKDGGVYRHPEKAEVRAVRLNHCYNAKRGWVFRAHPYVSITEQP
jgi:hypothetical protein